MTYLLDTSVVSELSKPRPHAGVEARLLQIDPVRLYLSVITIGEVMKGIFVLPEGARRRTLEVWAAGLESQFDKQILPIDVEVARIWGEITARARRRGIQIPAGDGLIAATALRHGLHVMTRNTADFAATGALIVDPWAD